MTVVVLSKVPPGLRGHLTKWLMEIAPGVYVGRVSARVRDELWQQVLDMMAQGEALMVESAQNEQGMTFRSHRHPWTAEDFDGVTLVRRPPANRVDETVKPATSRAARFRRIRRPK